MNSSTLAKLQRRVYSGIAVFVSLFLMVSVLFPPAVHAADIAGTSRTYLQSRETLDNTVLPLYEYLDFSVQNMGDTAVSAYFGAWGRYDLGDESFGGKTDNDLQYGYLSYRKGTANTVVNLGRVIVFEGVANDRVDGLYARTDLRGGVGIAAFGGVPVETELDLPGNNTIYGARLSQGSPGVYMVGLSYLLEEKNSADFRKEEGLDVWLHPLDKVDIAGRSSYNSITSDWMEHTYNLVLGPFAKLRLTTQGSIINYRDFFQGTTAPMFRLQAGLLDPNEEVQIIGQTAGYEMTDTIAVAADYKQYSYEIAGDAKYYGGTLGYRSPESSGAGLSVHRMAGTADRLKYNEYRLYSYKKMGRTDVAVDLINVNYDNAINGESNSYSATVAGGYELTTAWRLGGDVEYLKTPDFDKDVRAFVKAIYRFDAGSGSRKGV